MNKLYFLWFCILIVLFGTNETFADQPEHHKRQSMEKISQIKKIKLLDDLDLDEALADKFLVKYSTWEKKMKEYRRETDIAREELEEAIEKKENYSVKTNDFLAKFDKMQKVIKDRNADIKTILNEEQYARFILFEDRFMSDLQKKMFRMMRNGELPPPSEKNCQEQ